MKPRAKSPSPKAGNLAECIRAFFDWLVSAKNVSPHTIHAYRDAVTLFVRFLVDHTGQKTERLSIDDKTHDLVLAFLRHIETERKVSITTRNHRLSALKSFFHFVAYREPLLAAYCRQVTLIPIKKREKKLLEHLETDEMEAILAAADRGSAAGRRDYSALLFLYNTGCRASELAGMQRDQLNLAPPVHARILGKGRRWRTVPLWSRTVDALQAMLRDRRDSSPALFLNQRKESLTRAGVRFLVRKYAAAAAQQKPEIAKRNVTPHTIRHTTAVALLRATGDIDATAKILGHASLNTTKIYTDKDRTRLAEMLSKVSSSLFGAQTPEWKPPDDLLNWLEAL